jgi:hypothetical protein
MDRNCAAIYIQIRENAGKNKGPQRVHQIQPASEGRPDKTATFPERNRPPFSSKRNKVDELDEFKSAGLYKRASWGREGEAEDIFL